VKENKILEHKIKLNIEKKERQGKKNLKK
jgi:hypothetical protein